jgi:hypothetical protein
MTKYAFTCVKCAAGCFAYVDECRPVQSNFIITLIGNTVYVAFFKAAFHGKGMFSSTLHVPTNPILGCDGLQYPHVSAAAVLKPNIIRAGRMGRWKS